MKNRSLIAAAALTAALAVVSPDPVAAEPRPRESEIGEVHEYASPGEAVREIFAGVDEIETLEVTLTAEEMEALRTGLGYPGAEQRMTLLLPRATDGALLGYAVIANETGKYRPITFLVGTTPDLRVQGVEVLVYRESRGGEVRRSRFLRQYRGKSSEDPIRTHRDIVNIAGATISVTALNQGVKRVLLTLELLQRRALPVGRHALDPDHEESAHDPQQN